MNPALPLEQLIFSTPDPIASYALEVFAFQFAHNAVYREFAKRLNRTPENVKVVADIPYLPIEFFKTHQVVASPLQGGDWPEMPAPVLFRSSGTTGQITSIHEVIQPSLYQRAYLHGFRQFYGDPSGYRILALLPGYLERSDSSLVHMVQGLIAKSDHPEGGFFLDNVEALAALLQKPSAQTTLLIGVSFALLDLAESHPMKLTNTIVMETGGMKGRRRELIRNELHECLCEGLGVESIHSEYGMTELLSQAYAKSEGHFETPPWMALHLRDTNDPLSPAEPGRTGAINVIDLTNLYSCSFIATSDLGRTLPDGTTEVLGRMDYSDMRGCNLMVGDL